MRVTVVTPSYNQGEFVERTVRSVLSQRGPFDLEYLVIDGGSTDRTLEVLRPFQDRLQVISEKDRGQSDAINKGFRMATGEVLAWLNSDDTYEPGAIAAAVETLAGGARWCFGQCRIVDEEDREIRRGISAYKAWCSRRYSRERLLSGNLIPQPAVFFRRELLEEAGPLDESLHYSMDYDLWLSFASRSAPVFVPRDLACFRWHRRSKTGSRYVASAREALRVARRHAGPGDRFALLRHRLMAAGMVAVYGLLGAVGR